MKKLWKNNRVLVLLLGILLLCFIAIIVVALSFMRPTGTDPRLVDMDKYEVSKKFQDKFKEDMLNNEHVTKASISVNDKSRVIYITLNFDDEAQIEYAKDISSKSLDLFEEKYLGFYEFNIIVESPNPDYEDNVKALKKQFDEAEITEEEYNEALEQPENQKFRFIAIGAKNLNVDHISWTNNKTDEKSDGENQ